MAESVGKLALDVLTKSCHSNTCSYRAGDSQSKQNKLVDRLNEKLKHRVADGNEVRALETRVEILEKAMRACLATAVANKDKGSMERIKAALYPDKKKDK